MAAPLLLRICSEAVQESRFLQQSHVLQAADLEPTRRLPLGVGWGQEGPGWRAWATMLLWSSSRRALSTRTMAASTCGRRSSSTCRRPTPASARTPAPTQNLPTPTRKQAPPKTLGGHAALASDAVAGAEVGRQHFHEL